MRTLVFITDRFPYGKGEAFIENEIPYLAKAFDRVIVFPTGLTVNTDFIRELPDNFTMLSPSNTDDLYRNGRPSKLKRIIWSLKHMVPWCLCSFFTADFWNELHYMRSSNEFNVKRIPAVIRALAPLIRNNKHFRKQLLNMETSLEGDVYVYSYWASYSVCKIKQILPRKCMIRSCIARAHGYDLYNERRTCRYIPFRCRVYEEVDHLCLISEDGFNYVSKEYPQYQNKYEVAYLGTKDYGFCEKKYSENFVIATCSSVIPVKRVERIAEVLSSINADNIVWYHFGGGQDFESFKSVCKSLLSKKDNIEYHLMGHVKNSDFMEFYRDNKVDLFINVSESEGLPVSIMEALSFGIPVIATDVGSTRETIIENENGILLKDNFSNTDLTDAINFYLHIGKEDHDMQCLASRKLWETKFSAANNYPAFVKQYFKE